MKKIVLFAFTTLIVTGLMMPQIFAQPMELKGVSFLPRDHRLCAMIPVWIDKVNTELKDSIKVNWLGGPEVMPPFEQPEAIRKGIFQIGFIPAAYYSGILPEARYDFPFNI